MRDGDSMEWMLEDEYNVLQSSLKGVLCEAYKVPHVLQDGI